MYTNYQTFPNYYNCQDGQCGIPNNDINNNNDDRFIGAPLLAPFLLGGIAGAAAAPYFYPRPYYPYTPYPPYPYPPYGRYYW